MSEKTNPEDVEKLYRDGWKFRVKTIKGKQYLSARKGGEEKGLGPASKDLLDTINELSIMRKDLEVGRQSGLGISDANSTESSTSYTVSLGEIIYPTYAVEAEFTRDEMDKILFDIRYERARVKMRDCEHSFNGYCQFWYYMRDSQRMHSIYERFNGRDLNYHLGVLSHYAQLEVENREMFRVNELLCLDCDEYTLRVKKERPSPPSTKLTR